MAPHIHNIFTEEPGESVDIRTSWSRSSMDKHLEANAFIICIDKYKFWFLYLHCEKTSSRNLAFSSLCGHFGAVVNIYGSIFVLLSRWFGCRLKPYGALSHRSHSELMSHSGWDSSERGQLLCTNCLTFFARQNVTLLWWYWMIYLQWWTQIFFFFEMYSLWISSYWIQLRGEFLAWIYSRHIFFKRGCNWIL